MEIVKKDSKETKDSKPKKEEYIPRIVVCPDFKSLEMVQTEFISLLGIKSLGLCLITLNEAIDFKLPLRKVIEDFDNKIAHPIYLAGTVKEMIPKGYKDPKETTNKTTAIDISLVVRHFQNNPRIQERNKPCLCGSGIKYKKCCMLSENNIYDSKPGKQIDKK
jgi:SEC-C motif